MIVFVAKFTKKKRKNYAFMQKNKELTINKFAKLAMEYCKENNN